MPMKKNIFKSFVATVTGVSLFLPCQTVFAAPIKQEPVVSVVNFDPVYGNKELNKQKMTEIIENAYSSNTDIIVFPEMALTGYASSEDSMPASLAETKDGESAKYFYSLASKYDMYIVYGAPEAVEGDPAHAYDSAFVVSPDGFVDSYQKQIITDEKGWCIPGNHPVTFSTPFGKVGLSLGDDTFDLITQDRMYSKDGCFMIASPTALEAEKYTDNYKYEGFVSNPYSDRYIYLGWDDLNRNRVLNASYLSGLYIATANLIGKEGAKDELLFAGGSNITGENDPDISSEVWSIWKTTIEQGADYVDYIMHTYAGSFDGNETLNTSAINPEFASHGLVDMDIYQPNLYTKWFKDIAEKKVKARKARKKNGPVVAVVNMSPEYANCDANLKTMLDYMKEAASQKVNILVFPEMSLGDYVSTSDPESIGWKTVIDTAQTIDGTYAKTIAAKAKEYGMYVIYGTPEVNANDPMHPFNSAFVATPKGNTMSYQKVQPVEGDWATKGIEPLIIDTPWGGLGIAICMDVYAYPEMAQYYAAAGCTMYANPTASGGYAGSNFIYNTTLSTITARDGLAVLSSDLVNTSGYEDSSLYPGKSTIIDQNGVSPVYLSGESMVEEKMYVAKLDLTDNVNSTDKYFNSAMISECMSKLSSGETIYDGNGRVYVGIVE